LFGEPLLGEAEQSSYASATSRRNSFLFCGEALLGEAE
jgi:hypothetical protein